MLYTLLLLLLQIIEPHEVLSSFIIVRKKIKILAVN